MADTKTLLKFEHNGRTVRTAPMNGNQVSALNMIKLLNDEQVISDKLNRLLLKLLGQNEFVLLIDDLIDLDSDQLMAILTGIAEATAAYHKAKTAAEADPFSADAALAGAALKVGSIPAGPDTVKADA
jgi:hypothetical protein